MDCQNGDMNHRSIAHFCTAQLASAYQTPTSRYFIQQHEENSTIPQSVSCQEKACWLGWCQPSLFWYENNRDLKTCFSMTWLTSLLFIALLGNINSAPPSMPGLLLKYKQCCISFHNFHSTQYRIGSEFNIEEYLVTFFGFNGFFFSNNHRTRPTFSISCSHINTEVPRFFFLVFSIVSTGKSLQRPEFLLYT